MIVYDLISIFQEISSLIRFVVWHVSLTNSAVAHANNDFDPDTDEWDDAIDLGVSDDHNDDYDWCIWWVCCLLRKYLNWWIESLN